MFKELHPLIRRTTLHILITAEGDLLRVNITPKATDGENPALATPISLLATPEELDAELATILAGYTDAHMDLRASLNNAVAQIEEGKQGAGKKTESKPAAAKKPAKAKADPAEPGAPATPEPEKEPDTSVDEEGNIVATDEELAKAEAAQSLELPAGSEPVEQPSIPTEAEQPAEQIPEQQGEILGQEPENPAPAEKDTNTIELF